MWMHIAKASDDIAEHGRAVDIGGKHVALFKLGGCYYATSNVCTHQFALMTEGCVDGEYVECPMHQGRFHIPTGKAQGSPVSEALQVYATRIEDGEVQIDFPQDVRVRS